MSVPELDGRERGELGAFDERRTEAFDSFSRMVERWLRRLDGSVMSSFELLASTGTIVAPNVVFSFSDDILRGHWSSSVEKEGNLRLITSSRDAVQC